MIVSLDSLLPAAGTHLSTTYADWVAANDPDAAGTARDLVEDMGSELNRSWTEPGRFVDTMAARARRLPPAHLPWFWDTVGHRLIGYGNRPGGRAYVAARAAEARHGLPVDPGYRRANALLFAKGGAMPAKEFGAHQRFLAETLEPAAAHAALDAFLTAWAESQADLPADLVRRVRASAKAAAHGDEEVARLVGAILSVTRKKSVADALLTAAAAVLEAHPPTDTVAAGLVEVFPDGVTDGGAWLRMLISCGAAEAMESGRVVPEGGLHHWVGNFVRMYQYAARSGGGVGRQPLPAESSTWWAGWGRDCGPGARPGDAAHHPPRSRRSRARWCGRGRTGPSAIPPSPERRRCTSGCGPSWTVRSCCWGCPAGG
ncbi:hypothetical protein ACFV9D_25640 [Streptomyces sp. NPDC059875]|uniref:hypothetical protein n=1 Tax=unclassified Streptomyces TaxID=2593676 RepID=UPI003650DB1E